MAKTITKEEIEEAIQKLKTNKDFYDKMGKAMELLVTNILVEKKIPFHKINYRVKSEESLRKKVISQNKKIEEIKDLLGIRIISYLKSESAHIYKIIEEEFESNPAFTKDYSKETRTGYRGKNYVVKLAEKRRDLPEYSDYKETEFEIQVTTILNHAWAEIQHERLYKFKELPAEFKDQFEILATSLELIDRNFSSLCKDVDNAIKEVQKRTNEGDILGIVLDAISLRGFLNERFSKYLFGKPITPVFGEGDTEAGKTLNDLKQMNINNLEDLEKIIPSWVEDYLKLQKEGRYNYKYLINDLLTIHYKDEYVKKSEMLKTSQGGLAISLKEHEFLVKKGINFVDIYKRYKRKIEIEK